MAAVPSTFRGGLAVRARRRAPDRSRRQVAFANVPFANAANGNKITAARRRTRQRDPDCVGRQRRVRGRGQHRRGRQPDPTLQLGGSASSPRPSCCSSPSARSSPCCCHWSRPALAGLGDLGGRAPLAPDHIATFSNELALLIGLGVGVDYALFIVTRYRQAIRRGVRRASTQSSSPSTPPAARCCSRDDRVIAMLGMFALGVSFLYGVAIAAAGRSPSP